MTMYMSAEDVKNWVASNPEYWHDYAISEMLGLRTVPDDVLEIERQNAMKVLVGKINADGYFSKDYVFAVLPLPTLEAARRFRLAARHRP
jgi:hypothetical protein